MTNWQFVRRVLWMLAGCELTTAALIVLFPGSPDNHGFAVAAARDCAIGAIGALVTLLLLRLFEGRSNG
jgi:hypothetical protein